MTPDDRREALAATARAAAQLALGRRQWDRAEAARRKAEQDTEREALRRRATMHPIDGGDHV